MSTADVEWTPELVLRLIDEYKSKPELWDNHHDLYRVQTAKYSAWSELAASFDCDIADLRKKINSVLASHRREKVKVRSGGRSSWFFYDHLSFLPHHLGNNISVTNSKPQEDSEQSSDGDIIQDMEDSGLSHEIIIKQEPAVVQRESEKNKYKVQVHKPRLTRTIKRRVRGHTGNHGSKLDSKIIETLRLIRRSDLSRKKDECDSFGEYIADSLRKHDERTQSMIKQAINNILFEQEMKKYSSGHYEVVITGVDENPLILGEADNNDK